MPAVLSLLPVLLLNLLIMVYGKLPDYAEFRFKHFKTSDGLVLDRNLYPLSEARTNFYVRNIGYVRLKDVSPRLIDMLLRLEDKRFYSHRGVDPLAVISALKDNLIHKRRRGASTIDMQFVRVYFNISKENIATRKIKEMVISLLLNLKWERWQILEAYLNTVPIKGEITGIYTASWGIFEKSPEFLSDIESAILLSLIKNPSASKYELKIKTARTMKILGLFCDESMLNKLIDKVYMPINIPKGHSHLPVLTERLLMDCPSPCVTTIDLEIQRKATEIVMSFVSHLKRHNLNDAALLVVDNKSGDILAYVPNASKYSSKRYVDGVTAKRQAGSTLKPFLYEYAIEQQYITAASILLDLPIYIGKETGIYSPQNYDRTYRGYVSARTALASSLNLPAIRLLMTIGVENFTSQLKGLGFDVSAAELDEDFFGESLAIGSLDVSLYELVRAYMTLANNGIFKDLHILGKRDPPFGRVLLNPASVFIIKSILSDRGARSPTFGLENTLSTPFFTAVKTGTSKDMRDNWCIGFSEHYTVGVWVGNFSGEPMYDVSGVHGASQIWFALMKELHRTKDSNPPEIPSGIVKKKISYSGNTEPERDEFFIKGTEPSSGIITLVSNVHRRIIYPPHNAIFAFDPEIPLSQQKVFVLVDCNTCQLLSDDQIVSLDKGFSLLDVRKGRHTLLLVDENGRSLDRVNYEIR